MTAIGSPFALGSAAKAETVAPVTPPTTAGAITEGVNALTAATVVAVAAPVIRPVFIFPRLHPAIPSVQTSIRQVRT